MNNKEKRKMFHDIPNFKFAFMRIQNKLYLIKVFGDFFTTD